MDLEDMSKLEVAEHLMECLNGVQVLPEIPAFPVELGPNAFYVRSGEVGFEALVHLEICANLASLFLVNMMMCWQGGSPQGYAKHLADKAVCLSTHFTTLW
jgi:hypothetical protein